MASRTTKTSPPSTWWLVVSIIIWVLAAASLIAAFVHQNSATEPIGEGEVFVADVEETAALVTGASTLDEGVRLARNHLELEAVSVVAPDGVIVASTSASLVGQPIANPLLTFAVDERRFGALAGKTQRPIEIDGVVEWPVDSVLYQVISPIEDGSRFIMLHYDVSDLLGRRVQPGEIQELTLQLLALGGVFIILGTAVFVGHARAVRRHHEMVHDTEILRDHSRALEEANIELGEARRKAESALSLAEEKMRIRSEFVLMINHELRTPLTSVVTGAELIRDGDIGPDDHNEVIESMIANGNRLNEIIDQILAVARIENRGISYEAESVPFEQVCATIRARLADDDIDASRTLVRTDVQTLAMVLGSLSDNARTHGATSVRVQASHNPGIEPMLELGERPDQVVYFMVADDGPGIDPEFLPRAFEKFEKNSFSSGTGLGLYMVRMMVDAVGGSIAVHTSSEGTTFQIALPAEVKDRAMEPV